MAVTIDGTTGITTPGLTNTGAFSLVDLTITGNTVIGNATTDTLVVGVDGIVKDTFGNVGIGTASPTSKFNLEGANATDGPNAKFLAVIRNSGTQSAGSGTGIAFAQKMSSFSANLATIEAIKENATTDDYASSLKFLTRLNANNLTERMRLDSAGNLMLGTTSVLTVGKFSLQSDLSTTNSIVTKDTGTTYGYNSYYTLYQNSSGGTVGGIGHVAVNSLSIHGQGDLQFFTGSGSTDKMRIDSSGNVGIGVTPSTWSSVNKALQLNSGASVSGSSSSVTQINVGANWYNNASGADTFIGTGYATLYQQNTGVHKWFTSTANGVAAGAITFTQAMTLDASGNVIIGTATSTASRLDVRTNLSATTGVQEVADFYAVTSGTTDATYGGRIKLWTKNINNNYWPAGLAAVNDTAGSNLSSLAFYTATSGPTLNERVRINSAGNMLIGTTSDQSMKLVVYASSYTDGIQVSNFANSTIMLTPSAANAPMLTSGGAAQNLTFGINSVEKMRIDSAGNVGIGTGSNALAGKLEISAGTGAIAQRWSYTADPVNYNLRLYTVDNGASDVSWYFTHQTNGANTNVLSFKAGNVGVGTNAPTQKLSVVTSSTVASRAEIYGDTNHRTYVYNQSISAAQAGGIGQGGYLSISSGGTITGTKSYASFNSYGMLISNESNQGFYFVQQAGGSTTTDGTITTLMKIDNAGKVGIGTGTTSPSETLHVSGSNIRIDGTTGEAGVYMYRASAAPDVRFYVSGNTIASPTAIANGANVGQIHWQGYDGTTYQDRAGIWAIVDGVVSSGTVPIAIKFLTGTTSITERMRIDSTGNMLLGTTSAATPSTTGYASVANTFGFKNRIINGGIMIDQRGSAGTPVSVSTTTFTYAADRFTGTAVASAGVFTLSQVTTAPSNFINSLKATVTTADASLAATDLYRVGQWVEGLNIADLGWGTAAAQSVTLSFWVYSNLTGTFGGSLINSAANYSYPFSYTISAANTWEQKSITIAGPTSGTWLTTNGRGVLVGWGLGVGSTYSGTAGSWSANEYYSATGATNVMGTLSNTFHVTGVQLEKGTVASSFDWRPYGTELRLCQRYYQYWGGETAYGYFGGTVTVVSTTQGFLPIILNVQMRASPSFTYVGALSSFDLRNASNASHIPTALAQDQTTTKILGVTITTSSLTANAPGLLIGNNSTAGQLIATAEL